VTGTERDAAIVQLFPLVKTIAQTVRAELRAVDVDDLIGDGCVGLIAAVDGFDPQRGMALERYARRKITYAMLDGVRRNDQLSQRARGVLVAAERDRFTIALQLGRMPSHAELERRHPKLRSAQCTAHVRRALSLDASVPVEALVAPDWQSDPASVLCARETERSVHAALTGLPQQQRELLRMYYARGLRLSEMARRLSVTKQRVAQLRDKVLASIRDEVLAS
jgi:RNA polymerase sigma factor for flagellar operon FliA